MSQTNKWQKAEKSAREIILSFHLSTTPSLASLKGERGEEEGRREGERENATQENKGIHIFGERTKGKKEEIRKEKPKFN